VISEERDEVWGCQENEVKSKNIQNVLFNLSRFQDLELCRAPFFDVVNYLSWVGSRDVIKLWRQQEALGRQQFQVWREIFAALLVRLLDLRHADKVENLNS
jgi:hypothetical protein